MEPLFLMLAFFLLMMIPMWLMGRSQKKRMAEQREMLKKIGVGDEVRTHSGFYGMIVEEIGDDAVILETEDGSQLKWARQAIAEPVHSFGAEEAEAATSEGSPAASPTTSNDEVAGVTVDESQRHENKSDRDFA